MWNTFNFIKLNTIRVYTKVNAILWPKWGCGATMSWIFGSLDRYLDPEAKRTFTCLHERFFLEISRDVCEGCCYLSRKFSSVTKKFSLNAILIGSNSDAENIFYDINVQYWKSDLWRLLFSTPGRITLLHITVIKRYVPRREKIPSLRSRFSFRAVKAPLYN